MLPRLFTQKVLNLILFYQKVLLKNSWIFGYFLLKILENSRIFNTFVSCLFIIVNGIIKNNEKMLLTITIRILFGTFSNRYRSDTKKGVESNDTFCVFKTRKIHSTFLRFFWNRGREGGGFYFNSDFQFSIFNFQFSFLDFWFLVFSFMRDILSYLRYLRYLRYSR